MNISVEGPKGGKIDLGLQAYATLAARSFAKQLGISRLRTNIVIKIHNSVHCGTIGTEGLCESIDQRHFIIDVALFTNWLSTLAHEMVHVKQFAKGELDSALTQWKSNKYCENIEYWDQPWEKEARRLQQRMVEVFDKELE